MNEKMVHTCGQCMHGVATSAIITDPLECRCNPPQVWTMPDKSGTRVMATYPRLPRNFLACSQFKPRLAG